jgi:hypothetical protein
MNKLKTEKDQRKVLTEVHRRKTLVNLLRDSLFEEQLKFIDDPAKLKTAQCTRRAGKSYGFGVYASIECIEHPGSTCLYIAPTRDTAKKIMYKDVLKVINRKYNIGMKFNETTLVVTYPNGSVFYLIGTDSKPEEADKALGQKYRLAGIDESASWKNDQRHLVHSVLEPACADYEGTICMLGAPGNSLRTYFYDITGRPIQDNHFVNGWSRHKWGWQNNPHMREKVSKLIERLKINNPGIENTPIFRQMYMNEWVVDPGAMVYKFNENINLATHLPSEHKYYFCISVDLGYEDDTAFVISAYSDTDPNMYYVEASKHKNLDITAVANILTLYKQKYSFTKWVIDGQSKQAVVELKNRHGFPFVASDKQGKSDIIEIMNADFTAGRIKVLPAASCLIDEWTNLIWDDRAKTRQEHPACPNHAADAGLYGWRTCYHYFAKPLVAKAKPNSHEAMEDWWETQAKRGNSSKNEDFATRDFGKDYGM